jgi:hypothetical protein
MSRGILADPIVKSAGSSISHWFLESTGIYVHLNIYIYGYICIYGDLLGHEYLIMYLYMYLYIYVFIFGF